MRDEGGGLKTARVGSSLAVVLFSLFAFACATNQGSRNIPPEVESAIGTINDEIAAERYDKIYSDASELWRQNSTLDRSEERRVGKECRL